jgi:CRP-like cAMP-binding protein
VLLKTVDNEKKNYILTNGTFFGHYALCSSSKKRRIDVLAVVRCTLLVIKRTDFLKLISKKKYQQYAQLFDQDFEEDKNYIEFQDNLIENVKIKIKRQNYDSSEFEDY